MLQFVAFIAVAGLWSLAMRRSPLVLGSTSIVLWALVPGVAASVVTGIPSGPLNVQPGALLALLALVVQLLTRPRAVGRVLAHRPAWTILLTAVSIICVGLGAVSGRGLGSLAAAIDQVVGPIALFYLLGMAILDDDSAVDRIRALVLAIAAAESVLAVVQFLRGDPIVFADQLGQIAIVRQESNRWMGSFDHPLVLSFYLVIALFLLAGVRRWWLVALLATAMVAGIVVTQSRVGVGFGTIALVYLLVRSPMSRFGKGVLVGLITLGVVLAVREGVLDLVLDRLRDDRGSSSARSLAYSYFVDNARDFIWLGEGLNGSFAVSTDAGLPSSFESALLMYAIDIGLVAALMYFGVMVAIMVRSLRAVRPGIAGAAVATVIIPQTFSALSGSTAAPMVLWVVLALGGYCRVRMSAADRERRRRRLVAGTRPSPLAPSTRPAAVPPVGVPAPASRPVAPAPVRRYS